MGRPSSCSYSPVESQTCEEICNNGEPCRARLAPATTGTRVHGVPDAPVRAPPPCHSGTVEHSLNPRGLAAADSSISARASRKAAGRAPFQQFPANQLDSPAPGGASAEHTPASGMKLSKGRAGAAVVGSQAHGSSMVESAIRVYIRTRPSATVTGASCVSLNLAKSTYSLIPAGSGGVGGTPGKARGGVTTPRGNVGGPDTFHFEDGVLPEDVTQEEVFERVGRPAAEAVLAGFNVTIFAYGQTGCRPPASSTLPACPFSHHSTGFTDEGLGFWGAFALQSRSCTSPLATPRSLVLLDHSSIALRRRIFDISLEPETATQLSSYPEP